ncbi:MAG: c-type cytochrome [Anaerolinea sp.]|nr:c-type cytochrome [Anaerolinea sp.]
MAAHRLNNDSPEPEPTAAHGWFQDKEWLARLFLLLLILGLPAAILFNRSATRPIVVRAVMPEQGGWLPDTLTAQVGVPLHLHLIAEDVMHGFAVGQTDWPAVDLPPGQMTSLSLTFAEPGVYTYYCTRWCGPNHWRMRGVIEVTGADDGGGNNSSRPASPLYVTLGLDIDAPHLVDVELVAPPSAARGAEFWGLIPPVYTSREVYLTQPPYNVWQELRTEAETAVLSDSELWDVVAAIWRSHSDEAALALGQRLYAENCAACHGESGAGDGVFGQILATTAVYDHLGNHNGAGDMITAVTDFTDAASMMGASAALLDGKIRRGGMGTGMPYWGTIFTDAEIEALIAYLWRFQMSD